MNIPEETFRKWDDIFLPPFDLIYLEEDTFSLPTEIMVMPIEELKANPYLNTVNVNTTFTPWNIKSDIKYVAVIENEQFENIDPERQQQLLARQHELGRGNFFQWNELTSYIDLIPGTVQDECINRLNKMAFQVKGEVFVTLRRNHWTMLPWSFRKNVLKSIAESYSVEAISHKIESENSFTTLCTLVC